MNDNELDLAVAKHVFGETFLRCKLGIPMDAHLNGGCDNCLSYSTTGDGLLAVIEKMRERLCTPHILIGAKHTFATFLAPENRVAHDPFKDQSAPRAVAIAALRALGVEL